MRTEERKGTGVPFLKHDSMNVNEYGFKFTKLSRYSPEMVKDMRIRMSLFVAELGRASSKEGRAAMLIGDMDIFQLVVYVQQFEEEKLRTREIQKHEIKYCE